MVSLPQALREGRFAVQILAALAIGMLAINGVCDALCWLDPTAGVCRW